jgi:oxygen-independent coproporphyrinogen-3 oxidase
MVNKRSIELTPVSAENRPRGVSPADDLEALLGVEECVRYYPPNLAPATDPGAVYASPGPAREIDIFVDVPFCPTICGFCPFNVYTFDESSARAWLDALTREVEAIQARYDFSDLRIRTVWVGGGTPSVLTDAMLDELLTMLRTRFDLTRLAEMTVEIKPSVESLTDSKIALLHEHGVPRISMGVQSTHESYLRMLGRGHTSDEAFAVIDLIKGAGFALNIDMMYRLPGQALDSVDADIAAVASLGLDHISWFPYVPHEGTTLASRLDRGRVSPQADRSEYFTMFTALVDQMRDAGFEQYTPYHFGTARCDYHVGRWGMPQRDTLGIGPGAFGFFNGWIYANVHHPGEYETAVASGAPPVMKATQLNEVERITRLAVLGIKLFGFDFADFQKYSGVSFEQHYAEELAFLEQAGMVVRGADRIDCTDMGRAFNNDVATIFATDQARRTKHPQAIELMRAGL